MSGSEKLPGVDETHLSGEATACSLYSKSLQEILFSIASAQCEYKRSLDQNIKNIARVSWRTVMSFTHYFYIF